mmetsp:Transcript_22173/g.40794  ORF Transcript_22173/g.40794 Transcript_22173/m.40794 type:complete len:245 (+) Transcript_22173:98-832(+)
MPLQQVADEEEREALVSSKNIELATRNSCEQRRVRSTSHHDGGLAPNDQAGSALSAVHAFAAWVSLSDETVKVLVVRLYYSALTARLHAMTFVLGAILLTTALGFDTPLRGRPHLQFFLEACVSLSLALEVALKIRMFGCEYAKSYSNVLDAVVALASIAMLVGGENAHSKATHTEDIELSESLVMMRIMMQFGRLLIIAEHVQRSRKYQSGDEMASPFDDLDFDFGLLRERGARTGHRPYDDL